MHSLSCPLSSNFEHDTAAVHTDTKPPLISTTIESRKFRIPSDLRRQPGYRPVSSKVGDHLRILLGVVVHFFLAGNEIQEYDPTLIIFLFLCIMYPWSSELNPLTLASSLPPSAYN